MNLIGCRICHSVFPSVEEYIRHSCCKSVVDIPFSLYKCLICNNGFPSGLSFGNHICQGMKRKNEINEDGPRKRSTPEVKKKIPEMNKKSLIQVGRGRRTSLGSRAQVEMFEPQNTKDLLREMKEQEHALRDHLIERLHKLMKWYIVVYAEFKRDIPTGDGTITEQTRQDYISSPTFTAYNTMDIDQDLPTAFKELFSKFDAQAQQGSGWYLNKLIHLEVHTAQAAPLAASSYIELPKRVKNTKGVINIQNEDNKCFIWSILAHLHPTPLNPCRVARYKPFEDEMDIEGIDFPTPINQIPNFEKKNDLNINVFGWEKEEVVPIYISRHSSETVINLLLISKDDKRHYCLIKNFSRLMAYRTKHHKQQFYCFTCLHGFSRQQLLDQHREVCGYKKVQRLTFPEDTTIRFTNIAKQQKVPFCIYADFECCTERHEGDKYQHHKPNSFAYIVVSEYENPDPVLYRGDHAVEKFIKWSWSRNVIALLRS